MAGSRWRVKASDANSFNDLDSLQLHKMLLTLQT